MDGTIWGVSPADTTLEKSDECLIVSVPLARKDKLQFDPTTTVTVAFGGDMSGITETFETLIEIYNFVALDVLPRFDRFFS